MWSAKSDYRGFHCAHGPPLHSMSLQAWHILNTRGSQDFKRGRLCVIGKCGPLRRARLTWRRYQQLARPARVRLRGIQEAFWRQWTHNPESFPELTARAVAAGLRHPDQSLPRLRAPPNQAPPPASPVQVTSVATAMPKLHLRPVPMETTVRVWVWGGPFPLTGFH
jgi:hypothetical protein